MSYCCRRHAKIRRVHVKFISASGECVNAKRALHLPLGWQERPGRVSVSNSSNRLTSTLSRFETITRVWSLLRNAQCVQKVPPTTLKYNSVRKENDFRHTSVRVKDIRRMYRKVPGMISGTHRLAWCLGHSRVNNRYCNTLFFTRR